MNIQLNESIDVSFDTVTLGKAGELFAEIRQKQQTPELILDALFVLLAFRQLEKSKPGTLNRLSEAVKTASSKK